MKYRLLLLVSLIVLAACEPNFVPNDNYDWCYLYDFQNMTEEDAEFITITKGEFVPAPGGGLKTVDNELVVSWTKTGVYVTADIITIYGRRGVDSGNIGIQGDFVVLGVDGLLNTSVPGGLDVFSHSIPQDTVGSDGIVVNATIQTDGEIYITGLAISGEGAPPFPQNPCDPNATPTPTTSNTPDATTTLTPTGTLTPTVTHTVTTTPTCQTVSVDLSSTGYVGTRTIGGHFWYRYNTTALQSLGSIPNPWPGYAMYLTGGQIRAGRYATTYGFGVTVHLRDSGGGTINTTNVFLDNLTFRSSQGGRNILFHVGTTPGGIGFLNSFSPPVTDLAYIEIENFSGGQGSGNPIEIAYVQFYACRGAAVGTPTPTATHTSTNVATSTRTPLFGDGSGTPSKTPTKTAIVVSTPTTRPTSTTPPTVTSFPTWTPPPPPTIPATPTYITVTPQTYTPVASSTPNPVSATPFGTPGGTPWGTPVSWGTPWGTPGGPGGGTPFDGVSTLEGFPTLQAPDYGGVYDFMSTAVYAVGSLPFDISGTVPDLDARPLFAYTKWALSCSSVQELMGKTLAPPVCHALVGVSLNILLAGILLTIRVVRLTLRVALWIFNTILKFVPFMG